MSIPLFQPESFDALQAFHHAIDRPPAFLHVLADSSARAVEIVEALLAKAEFVMEDPEEIERDAVDGPCADTVVVVRVHVFDLDAVFRLHAELREQVFLRHVVVADAFGEVLRPGEKRRQTLAAESIVFMERRVEDDLHIIPGIFFHFVDFVDTVLCRVTPLLCRAPFTLRVLRFRDALQPLRTLRQFLCQSHIQNSLSSSLHEHERQAATDAAAPCHFFFPALCGLAGVPLEVPALAMERRRNLVERAIHEVALAAISRVDVFVARASALLFFRHAHHFHPSSGRHRCRTFLSVPTPCK